ncbi:phosphate transport system permease protein [Ketogulonicigenium robustum]|uniref:Phosphate transport system permease protein n=1 Tax=Ketogulonicigenium robustum TaxID=92947 RepID=A0A1W6P0Y9_9RHOB|nr:phosphate ABC transporter permease subunit PstC [Ketogulonicigenium robustum]ARO14990.1 phosphate transport system permease protein [Ketogulonicigenium robustum]
MPLFWTFIVILLIAAAGFWLGRARALQAAGGTARGLHSLPRYYGWNVAIWALIPAFLLILVWLVIQPAYVNHIALQTLGTAADSASSASLLLSDVHRLARDLGRGIAIDPTAVAYDASVAAYTANATGRFWMSVAAIALSVAGAAWAYTRTNPAFRARPRVEAAVRVLLIAAAMIAILTTVGIVIALIFNTIAFFRAYPALDFFFGLTWSPSFGGGSQLGILPLLWGTLYISFIALLVAVPLGLFAAIYLSEYASPKVRALGKPMLEILAGIPTIVYGLFALATVGPLLMQIFGPGGLLGVGWMRGGTAVMTAGLVMGVMIIPFVSSLSDDIINAVPQSLRDGSLGLGATRSETIRQVILPAALPGIAGAILLAASRAIGETMIVVMGAGAAGALSMNPFDAMTTVTAKIVSQLTGDADFSSPEALVAFALGMTLFVITLALNILAMAIVRKYREQYE